MPIDNDIDRRVTLLERWQAVCEKEAALRDQHQKEMHQQNQLRFSSIENNNKAILDAINGFYAQIRLLKWIGGALLASGLMEFFINHHWN